MVSIKNRLYLYFLGSWCTVKKRLSPLAVYSQHFLFVWKKRERYSWREMKDHLKDQMDISLSKTCHPKETYVGSMQPLCPQPQTAPSSELKVWWYVLATALYVHGPVYIQKKCMLLFFFLKNANSTKRKRDIELFNFYTPNKKNRARKRRNKGAALCMFSRSNPNSLQGS